MLLEDVVCVLINDFEFRENNSYFAFDSAKCLKSVIVIGAVNIKALQFLKNVHIPSSVSITEIGPSCLSVAQVNLHDSVSEMINNPYDLCESL